MLFYIYDEIYHQLNHESLFLLLNYFFDIDRFLIDIFLHLDNHQIREVSKKKIFEKYLRIEKK